MSLTVFSTLITAVQGVLGVATDFAKADEHKRYKIAGWMQELSEILTDIADKVELGEEYPYNACAQMEIMVDKFPDLVGDLVTPKKLKLITEHLKASTDIEKLFGELNAMDDDERYQMITALLFASGKLEGLASIIRHLD